MLVLATPFELTTNQVTSNESENDWNESNELEGNDGDNAEDPGNDE